MISPYFFLFFHLRLTLRRSLFSTFGEGAKLSFDREAQVIFMSFLFFFIRRLIILYIIAVIP